MAGVGPEWVHVRQGAVTTNSVAGEAVLAHHLYLEQFFDTEVKRNNEGALGVNGKVRSEPSIGRAAVVRNV